MSAGLPLALRIGRPFESAAFDGASRLERALYQALVPPGPFLDPIAFSRLDDVAGYIARATGDRDEPQARAHLQPHARTPDGNDAPRALVSHPYHAAMATPVRHGPMTRAAWEWTTALLGAMRLAWPHGRLPVDDPRDALYRTSLLVRRLLADPAWPDLCAPPPPMPMPARLPSSMSGPIPRALRAALAEILASLARARPARRRVAGLPGQQRVARDAACEDRSERVVAIEPDLEGQARLDDADDIDAGAVGSESAANLFSSDACEAVQATHAFDGHHAAHWQAVQETEEATRRLRGGQLTLAEYRRMLAALESAPLEAAARHRAQVVLLAVGALGIAWSALPASLAPVPVRGAPGDARAGLILRRRAGEAMWEGWRQVPSAMLPPPPADADPALLHSTVDAYRLPVHPAIAARLAAHLSALPGAAVEVDGDDVVLRWPTRGLSIAAYERHVEALRGGRAGLRLEAGRVPSVFARALDADPAMEAATRETLQPGDGAPVGTAQFYTALSLPRLARCYLDAQSRVAQALADDAGAVPMPPAARACPPTGWTGSRRCPTPDAVQQAGAALQEAIRATRCTLADPPTRWARHHNARCIAIAFALHAALGLRRSVGALHEAEADLRDGWMILRDKGPLQRLLPIAPLRDAFWNAHGEHLERFWNVACTGPRAASAAATSLCDAWQAQQLAPACLALIDPDTFRLRAWEPADLDRALRDAGVALPTQCLRHAARSAWVEEGVEASDIDALCGHYRRGAEPWTAYSLHDVQRLLARLDPIVRRRLAAVMPRVAA